MRAGDLGGIKLLHRRDHLRITERLDGVIFIAEDEVDGEHAGFRLSCRGVGGR